MKLGDVVLYTGHEVDEQTVPAMVVRMYDDPKVLDLMVFAPKAIPFPIERVPIATEGKPTGWVNR